MALRNLRVVCRKRRRRHIDRMSNWSVLCQLSLSLAVITELQYSDVCVCVCVCGSLLVSGVNSSLLALSCSVAGRLGLR